MKQQSPWTSNVAFEWLESEVDRAESYLLKAVDELIRLGEEKDDSYLFLMLYEKAQMFVSSGLNWADELDHLKGAENFTAEEADYFCRAEVNQTILRQLWRRWLGVR